MDEVLREPGRDRDRRIAHRAEIERWISANRHRIKRLETRIGFRYAQEMRQYENALELWESAGRPAGREPERPEGSDRGDESVWVAVRTANAAVEISESVIALADDGEVRDAIQLRGRRQRRASIDLMGTQTFIRWMAEDFHIDAAATAWQTIAAARENKVPSANESDAADPIYIRTP
ncbi:MAG: hypothetical protein JO234_12090 [Hyphomicrobiales bacterium]|nr:hypothetical protein [Hyphomicrobiales bacterium]